MSMPDTILLVEDDENDVLFMKMAMEMTGIRNPLQVASDGRQALDYLTGANEYSDRLAYPKPGLVLLDLKLPYVNGLEVLRKLRLHPSLKQTVVIILTSSQEDSDINKAYQLGTNAYVVKPPDIKRLQNLVKAIKAFWLELNLAPRTSHDLA
jgi:two-component system response regulator